MDGPLTLAEQTDAIRLGLAVTRCESCGLPTLYQSLDRRTMKPLRTPLTCGRGICMQKVDDPQTRYRRRE